MGKSNGIDHYQVEWGILVLSGHGIFVFWLFSAADLVPCLVLLRCAGRAAEFGFCTARVAAPFFSDPVGWFIGTTQWWPSRCEQETAPVRGLLVPLLVLFTQFA
jgi:hypothetical protein